MCRVGNCLCDGICTDTAEVGGIAFAVVEKRQCSESGKVLRRCYDDTHECRRESTGGHLMEIHIVQLIYCNVSWLSQASCLLTHGAGCL